MEFDYVAKIYLYIMIGISVLELLFGLVLLFAVKEKNPGERRQLIGRIPMKVLYLAFSLALWALFSANMVDGFGVLILGTVLFSILGYFMIRGVKKRTAQAVETEAKNNHHLNNK